ncbi:MAG: DUF1552 domain-containing protein [Bryobacterales bacterium]|nr:DUF1552 domain-containing protein [Bryobacterales bacterium]
MAASKSRVSRRKFLKGMSVAGALARVALPPLDAMFNSNGTAYAAEKANGKVVESPIESRFVLWFNGNGIPERYWIPGETGPDYRLTPCLAPLHPFRNDIHVLTGIDNSVARLPGPGNDHHRAMAGLVTGTSYTGRGAGGPSIDQVFAHKLGGDSRFRSLQVGVCRECHGDSINAYMSWAGYDRALPPETIPQNLFDRIFGAKDQGWLNRKRSILDFVREDAVEVKAVLGKSDQTRLDEHLSTIRDLERAIASLPPESNRPKEPEDDGDVMDYPRIAKIQTDLMVHALAARQTRVASYMLTKAQGLTRFPWLGYTALRHHDYTHTNPYSPQGQRILRDICRWHIEEFAYLMAKLKSIREGDGTLLDHCCLLYLHEHAEANDHKNNGLAMILAGHSGRLKTGMHTKVTQTIGDLYLTLAQDVFKMPFTAHDFPTADRKIPGIV